MTSEFTLEEKEEVEQQLIVDGGGKYIEGALILPSYPDEYQVIIDRQLGGIIIPQEIIIKSVEVVGEIQVDFNKARRLGNWRSGLIAVGFTSELTGSDAPVSIAMVVGGFIASVASNHYLGKAAGQNEWLRGIFLPEDIGMEREIERIRNMTGSEEINEADRLQLVELEDGSINLFIPFEQIEESRTIRADMYEHAQTAKALGNEGIFTLTAATILININPFFALPPTGFYAWRSHKMIEHIREARHLHEEFLELYILEDGRTLKEHLVEKGLIESEPLS